VYVGAAVIGTSVTVFDQHENPTPEPNRKLIVVEMWLLGVF